MKSNCDYCMNLDRDEEGNEYCTVQLDEDEMARYLSRTHRECPYFQLGDEYTIVRRQN